MPEQTAAVAATEEGGGGGQPVWRSAIQGIIMFMAMQFALKQLGIGQQKEATDVAPPTPGAEGKAAEGYTYSYIPEKVYPLWPIGTSMDISIYLSETLGVPPLSSLEAEKIRVFDEKNFKLGDTSDSRLTSLTVPVSDRVKNNGTLWAHIFVAQSGEVMDPSDPAHDPAKAFRQVKQLTRFQPMKKVIKTKKLIGGSSEAESEDPEPEVATTDVHGNPIIASYWHSNVTLDVVYNGGALKYNGLPPPVRQYVRLEATGQRDETGRNGWYYPIIFTNDFWQLKEHLIQINNTVDSLPLHIHLNPSTFWKFQIYASLDEAFKQQQQQPGLGGAGSTGAELEEFKRVLVDTNIYLLATTIVVSILHSVFEILAFKSDISHWKNKKDNVGISVRTILANVFMQTIIFLYLIDNSDGTSWMILFGQGMGILIEAWKITKTVNVKIRPVPGALIPYRISFEDKHKLSDLEKETKEYDEIAFKYLYICAVPLLIAYAAYSLVYESHKSWYSFIITTLVGSVYAYGFLMMVPSLYINYRLKSVAHMPKKAMMYKFLNTFIDDLFAFTIKMPTLHRLATLRDDVIFFVYLYQSYKYKVDMKRVNEFGQGGEDEVEGAEKKAKELERKESIKKILTAKPENVLDDKAKGATGVSVEGKEGVKKRGGK